MAARIPVRPPADPLDDVDRVEEPVDSMIHRQDRADEAGQGPGRDAPSAEDGQVDDPVDEGDVEETLDVDPAIRDQTAHGIDSDEPIDGVERSGDDTAR